MTTTAAPAGLPLSDLRVVELGQLIAGPFCGQLLGDFGAEVIKVEDPRAGDPMRQWGREKPHGTSLWWPVLARNKKSVTADLRDPRGRRETSVAGYHRGYGPPGPAGAGAGSGAFTERRRERALGAGEL